MSGFVIFIVIVSTFMHAGWNLLARYERSERQFYTKMLIAMVVIGFVPAVWSEIVTRSLPPAAWWCIIGSGTCSAIYLFFLARAYESSDFTVVYPVARSLPVIFVAFIDMLRGRFLTLTGWIGILIVAGSCTLIPLCTFRDFSIKKYFNRASLWMFLAALGTVGYTFLDKIAAEVVHQGPATAARYGYMYFAFSLIPYLILVKLFKHDIPPKNGKSMGWKLVVPAAVFSFAAYWLVLWAYQLSPLASYIVAFRQFSIVIGAILAFIVFKEEGVAIRMTGALFITLGLILIGVWGR